MLLGDDGNEGMLKADERLIGTSSSSSSSTSSDAREAAEDLVTRWLGSRGARGGRVTRGVLGRSTKGVSANSILV